MDTKRFLGLAIATVGLGGIATSQQIADIVFCDYINDQFYILEDLDGDGDYLDANETRLFIDLTVTAEGGASPETLEMRDEGGTSVIYWVEDYTSSVTGFSRDGVWRAVDTSGDGVIQISETTHFYDSTAAIGSTEPEGVGFTDDGAVWFSSDWETGVGVFRCEDTDGNGDAMGLGETQLIVDGSGGVKLTVESDSGPQLGDTANYVAMVNAGNAIIVYSDGDDEASYRLEDINGDGDVLDAGEARLFLNASGKNSLLPQNADWAAGNLRTLEIPNPSVPTSPYYGRLNMLATWDNAGTREYFIGCDSSNTSIFSTSITGQGMNGLIYRGVDNNLDGDIQDLGEVTLYYDGSLTGPGGQIQAMDKILGMDVTDGWLYVCDLQGKRWNRMKDFNGDGDAMDFVGDGSGVLQDEVEFDIWSFSLYGAFPPFPSTQGPFIVEITTMPGGSWPSGGGAPNFTTSGTGCSTFGTVPSILGSGQAQIGTSNFVCSVTNTGPNLPAILWFGSSTTQWLGAPVLPLDLTPFGYPGCFMYHNIIGFFQTLTDGTGVAALPLPIPNDPTLVGFDLPLQWLVVDFLSSGIALTELGEVTME
jgi:hypothetical protein